MVAPAYHLVVHTSPNTIHPKGETSTTYWKTIADDYHWHIEILPIVETRSKSYSIKEVYYNAIMPGRGGRAAAQTGPHRLRRREHGGIFFRLLVPSVFLRISRRSSTWPGIR